jgi:hypothetical protein
MAAHDYACWHLQEMEKESMIETFVDSYWTDT